MKVLKLLLLIVFISSFLQFKINAQGTGKSRNLDIVFIGNSITAGALLDKPDKEAPPVLACKYLKTKPGVGDVAFSNQGRSGYTTVDYLPWAGKTFKEVVAAAREIHKDAKWLLVFSISLGTNDCAEKGPNGSPVDPKQYSKNMKTITAQLLTDFPGCKVIFQQPIWFSTNTYNSSMYMAEGLARLQTYFPELESLVAEYTQSKPGQVFMGDQQGFNYFNINHLTALIPESGQAGTFYLHPNKKGAEALGKFWGEAIYQRLIKN